MVRKLFLVLMLSVVGSLTAGCYGTDSPTTITDRPANLERGGGGGDAPGGTAGGGMPHEVK